MLSRRKFIGSTGALLLGAAAVERAQARDLPEAPVMDKAATQSAFSLTPVGGGAPVAGSFSWSGNRMLFKPAALKPARGPAHFLPDKR